MNYIKQRNPLNNLLWIIPLRICSILYNLDRNNRHSHYCIVHIGFQLSFKIFRQFQRVRFDEIWNIIFDDVKLSVGNILNAQIFPYFFWLILANDLKFYLRFPKSRKSLFWKCIPNFRQEIRRRIRKEWIFISLKMIFLLVNLI